MKAIAKTELIDINTHLGRIRAFSTQRDAADWSLPYSGFNVCHYTADKPAHIAECRRRLAAELNLPVENLIIPRQTHSANIAVVDSMPIGSEALENIDGIVTSRSDIALCINTADCVPVILVDPESGIIGAVHSVILLIDKRLHRPEPENRAKRKVLHPKRIDGGRLERSLRPLILPEAGIIILNLLQRLNVVNIPHIQR